MEKDEAGELLRRVFVRLERLSTVCSKVTLPQRYRCVPAFLQLVHGYVWECLLEIMFDIRALCLSSGGGKSEHC